MPERLHDRDVFLVAVVVVAGDVAGLVLPDRARLAAEHVPDRRALAVGGGRAFDLIRRRGGAPDEALRELGQARRRFGAARSCHRDAMMRPRPRTSQETDGAGSPCGRLNVHWRAAPRQTGIGREKLHNFDGMIGSSPATRMKKPLWIVLAPGACWRRRRRRLAVAQARRRQRGPALRDGRGRPRPDRRQGDRDRDAVGAGHGPGRQPGVGPHQGAQRRLQLAGEEGPGDREDRPRAVRRPRSSRRARTTWPRRAPSRSWRRRPRTPSCSTTARAGAVRAQGDRPGRPRHRAARRMRAANGDVAAARGNLEQAKARCTRRR